jgi:hypothetical protein
MIEIPLPPSPLRGEGTGEGFLKFGYWNLFGASDLVIGICVILA